MQMPDGWVFTLKPKKTSIEIEETELVKCRHCRFFEEFYRGQGTFSYKCLWWLTKPKPDDWCSKGARNE